MKGQHEEAKRILELLYPHHQETVEKEINNIELSLKASVNHDGLKSMFTMGPQRIFHRVILASVLQIMLQVSGNFTIWGSRLLIFS